MSKAGFEKSGATIGGKCNLEDSSFSVVLSNISPEGCHAEAASHWVKNADFLQLTIADQIEICGRVIARDGKGAEIGFFGQLHPDVIKHLGQLAA